MKILKMFLALLFLIIFLSLLFALTFKSKPETKETIVPMATIAPAVRKPAAAGSFYPADREELSKLISDDLGKTEKISTTGKLRILIVPHAGIIFSGQTATWGFRQIERQNFSHIFLLGVSHHAAISYAAVAESGSWETPLGSVPIDEEKTRLILDQTKGIIADNAPHNNEHALEMELIFLQSTLKNFKIVPILLGQSSNTLVSDLAAKIAQNFDDQTLLVVSSDLSHYPSWEVANEVDSQTINAILTGQNNKLEEMIKAHESKNYPNLVTSACGYQAIRVALKVAEILKINDIKEIKYENSGDIPQDTLIKAGVTPNKTQVVGYGAIGFWSDKLPSAAPELDENTKKEALTIARQTLKDYLTNKKVPAIAPENAALNQPLGAFVTLRKNGQLRGCIGEFEPSQPLYQVIQGKAIAAAGDPRFSPVTTTELPEIKIEISVISPKRKIDNWQEIKLGKHGVVVQKGLNAGTFLPQVATETGWTLENFLSELCSQKAGLPANCYQDPQVTLYTFEAQVFAEE
jgi:AmmeMemoRadiSam system protein B/AmmeMemoRadiSam system protein A